jgi:hypothetical protein
MRESNVLRSAWLALSGLTTLFRVNTGKGWVGTGGAPQRLTNGSVVLPNARPIALGFADPSGNAIEGTSDLIGWTSIDITPDMVGRRVAVFTAIETKATGGGHKRESQKNFIARLIEGGGIAGFADSADAAKAIVVSYVTNA